MQAFKHPSSAGLALVLSAALAGPAAAQTAPAAAPAPLHPALKAAAAEPGAVVTASGLVFRQLEAGQGAMPAATDVVRVHYRGTFPDGREFDSSYKRNQPASFALNRVIRCWTEGLQLMKAGATARLTCPADIAYGERGAGNGLIPPGAVLVFEVKLLGIGAN
ncbi:MAG: FKBP-type peptidyl-prolyl cis-trans isomerase FkpA [Pseudomonadota bacterium]|jgi:FKBP-type peptidyl-prolyl cis-trans isomerase FkpA